MQLRLKQSSLKWNSDRSVGRASIFSLCEFLRSLFVEDIPPSRRLEEFDAAPKEGTTGLTCRLCETSFSTFQEQRNHFKSAEHLAVLTNRMNVNTTDKDQPHENENENDSDGELLSDHDNESSENNDKGLSFVQQSTMGTACCTFSYDVGKQVWFTSRDDESWEFGISQSALLLSSESPSNWWSGLSSVTRSSNYSQWAVFLLRSGRFAGAMFDGTRLLAHRVFRRYTIRAKAGGSQSSYDNKFGAARSAGAMMRRHGEQALRDDVQRLLLDWTESLDQCGVILLSAPKVLRSVLFFQDGGCSSPLRKEDPRVRFVSCRVGRPTLEEVCAIHEKCSTVTFRQQTSVDPSTDHLQNASEATLERQHHHDLSESKKTPEDAPQLICPHKNKLLGQLIESRQEATALQLIREAAEAEIESDEWFDLNFPASLEDLKTPLHLAAETDQESIVLSLLRAGADPSRVDARGRLPYFAATEKGTREAFRRGRGEFPLRWDWDAAGVPPAITEESEKAARDKEKEKKRRARQRKQDEKRRQDEESAARIETLAREAREAEEQREAAQHRAIDAAGCCGSCGVSLYGIDSLAGPDIYLRVCSPKCLQLLKRKLMAQAALERISSSAAARKVHSSE